MLRTLQTTYVNTNHIPPPRQAPFYPVVVEEVHVELHHLQVRNGVILEDSSEEILATPTPLSESHAFVVGASSSAPPIPVAQAPAPGGDVPDDSGDDDEEEENNDNMRMSTMNKKTTSLDCGLSRNITLQCSRRDTFQTCCKMCYMRWEPMFDLYMTQGECLYLLGLITTSFVCI
jgi:hypothetical protein